MINILCRDLWIYIFCWYHFLSLKPYRRSLRSTLEKTRIVPRWRHQMETFPRYWPFVRGIHRSPMNSPHKGQWHRALMFSLTCAWTNGWVNNQEAGDLRHHCTHYDVTVMPFQMVNIIVPDDLVMAVARASAGIICWPSFPSNNTAPPPPAHWGSNPSPLFLWHVLM